MQHNVYQLVYTKVPPGESPWNIMDFHTVFYPVDILSGEDVNDMERMIHRPIADGFKDKFTVFFKEINGLNYLVILYTKDLPEDRDVFGRCGLFLCHGFLFPPELWMEAQTPLSLFEHVEDHVFRGIEVLLNSEMVDKVKGSIRPVSMGIQPKSMEWPPLSDRFKLEMVFYLFKAARAVNEVPNLILHGDPGEVSDLVDELLFYIPNELRVNLGWDSAFDGGTLYHYPLKVVGFQEERPYGGEQIIVDLNTGEINYPGLDHIFNAESAYECWFENCNEKLSKEDIETAYRLSLLLEGEVHNSSRGDLMAQLKGFSRLNRGLLENPFHEKFIDTFGLEAPTVPMEVMLEFLFEGTSSSSIVEVVESLVIDSSLTPEDINLPPEVISGSEILGIIKRAWDGLDVSDDIRSLEPEDRYSIIIYMDRTGLPVNEDLRDIGDGDFKLLEYFNYFNRKFNGPFEKIRGLIEVFLGLLR